MQLIDPAHPFYRPLWRRIAIVAVAAVWFLFELRAGHDTMFVPIAGAIAAYAAWVLLITWTPRGDA